MRDVWTKRRMNQINKRREPNEPRDEWTKWIERRMNQMNPETNEPNEPRDEWTDPNERREPNELNQPIISNNKDLNHLNFTFSSFVHSQTKWCANIRGSGRLLTKDNSYSLYDSFLTMDSLTALKMLRLLGIITFYSSSADVWPITLAFV